MSTEVKKLWVVQAIGNAVLAALIYAWLGIPDARNWQLAVTAVLGLVIVFGTFWLHASAFAFFLQEGEQTVRVAFRMAMKRLLPYAMCAAVFVGSLVAVSNWNPDGTALVVARWFILWIVVPLILLPAAAIALSRRDLAIQAWKSPRYWIGATLLIAVGLFLPLRLMLWAPELKSFPLEVLSFVVRWAIGYFAMVSAWVMLANVACGGKPRVSQLSTVASV